MSTRTRPTASASIRQVDGGLWQGACVCRWRGRRWLNQHTADAETVEHVAHCGECIRGGRDFMETCSCANCARRRLFRALP